ncbi:MAG: transposase [Candidatus Rokubacteria bacterium]|nr:transposase [Candidatus Rokubacteria bacterium]
MRRGSGSRHAAFLVPGRALSRLFRGKVRAGLRKAGLLEQVPPAVWRHEWVVHVQPAGTGEKVLEYLARYVFRIAIVNSRLERFEDGQVTFRYREGRTGLIRRCTLDAAGMAWWGRKVRRARSMRRGKSARRGAARGPRRRIRTGGPRTVSRTRAEAP